MFVVPLLALLLVLLATLILYEALGLLNARLPGLGIPNRSTLLLVILVAFAAHALQVAIYGFSLFGMVRYAGLGQLVGQAGFSLGNCLDFSAETCASLGFGDLVPQGPIRLVADVEALNGLLLVGWSASYTCLAMERFWGAC